MKFLPLILALGVAAASWGACAENVIRTQVPISKSGVIESPGIPGPAEPEPAPEPIARSSCLEILQSGDGASNGIYTISLNGARQSVYCDMTTSGGGWTMIVAQFEADPVTNWNEGIQPDYDPSLSSRKGFALSTNQIPSHTQVGFGQNLSSTALDYGYMAYSTGDFGPVNVTGLRSGGQFQAHRNRAYYYNAHDVGYTTNTAESVWMNTLTFDATTYRHAWAFSPMQTIPAKRGYAFAGFAESRNDDFAWTVWVR